MPGRHRRPIRVADSDSDSDSDYIPDPFPSSDDERPVPRRAASPPSASLALLELADLPSSAPPPPAYPCPKPGCNKSFHSDRELRSHKDKEEDHIYCRSCDLDFKTDKEYSEHLVTTGRHKACPECYREFRSWGGVRGHCKQFHRNDLPARCTACSTNYPSLAGLLQHYESNECSASLSRDIYHASLASRLGVTTRDTGTSLHIPGATARSASPNTVPQEQMRPRINILDYTAGIQGRKRYTASDVDAFWDGNKQAWCCPVRGCGKAFTRRQNGGLGLVAHLNSQVHAPATFRCCGCLDKFRSASALSQHMDTNSCGVLDKYSRQEMQKMLIGVSLEEPESEDKRRWGLI